MSLSFGDIAQLIAFGALIVTWFIIGVPKVKQMLDEKSYEKQRKDEETKLKFPKESKPVKEKEE